MEELFVVGEKCETEMGSLEPPNHTTKLVLNATCNNTVGKWPNDGFIRGPKLLFKKH